MFRSRISRYVVLPSLAVGVGGGVFAVGDSTTSGPKVAPAVVVGRVAESNLPTVTLTQEAVKRLDLRTDLVVEESLPRRRLFGAVAEVPVGRDLTFTAPTSGWVVSVAQAGSRVAAGDILTVIRVGVDERGAPLSITDRLALQRSISDLEAARVEATVATAVATERQAAAEAELARAEKLASDRAGSAKAVDEARATLGIARVEREGADSRTSAYERAIAALAASGTFDLELRAPFAGEIRDAFVTGNTAQGAGTALLRVVAVDDLLLRTFLPDAEVDVLRASVAFASRSSRPGTPLVEVERGVAPASARTPSTAMQIVFAVKADAFDPPLAPGERLMLRIDEAMEIRITVPHSSIVRDAAGGEWVYVEVGTSSYARRRVIVTDVVGERAVISSGPPSGSRVVNAGVAELFGTEFGAGK